MSEKYIVWILLRYATIKLYKFEIFYGIENAV